MSSTSKRNRSKRAPAARKLAVDSRLFADLQGQIAAIGFYFSPPLGAEACRRLLRQRAGVDGAQSTPHYATNTL
jgi:hypothetical protein